jgi:hypothetical protein
MLDKIKNIIEGFSLEQNSLPFNIKILEFINELSQYIITDINLRKYPDIVALGYWLRNSHIQKLKQNFQKTNQIKLPRGIAFHITPGNVDTMFAYSWLISLLAGNQNIVRLSTKSGEAQQQLVTVINTLLKSQKYKEIKKNNTFINYPHNDEITAFLSSLCDVRIIWGGDETIRKIRQYPTSTTCKEIVFADRFSLALFNSKEILLSDNLDKLCQLFYRDIFTFGQQACSSPRMLLWYGSKAENKKAKEVFWPIFKTYLKSTPLPDAASIVNKQIHCQLMAINSNQVNNDMAPYLSRIIISEYNKELSNQHCGEGLLYEGEVQKYSHLQVFMGKQFQTCTYYGFDKKEIENEILKGNIPHVLRFVQLGNALNFDTTWDGLDLFTELTKHIFVE